MAKYTIIHQSMPKYKKNTGASRYTKVSQSTSNYTIKVCQVTTSMPKYPKVSQSKPKLAKVCHLQQSMLKYGKVHKSKPKYTKICQSTT